MGVLHLMDRFSATSFRDAYCLFRWQPGGELVVASRSCVDGGEGRSWGILPGCQNIALWGGKGAGEDDVG